MAQQNLEVDAHWQAIMNPADSIGHHPEITACQHIIYEVSHSALAALAVAMKRVVSRKEGVVSKDVSARVATAPIIGQKKIVYAIEFSHGSRWCYKFPRSWRPGKWAPHDMAAFSAEIAIIKFVHGSTSIPMPRLFTWSPHGERRFAIPFPFFLMEWIDAHPLEPAWTTGPMPADHLEPRTPKERTIISLACHMNQLSRFRYSQGGVLSWSPKLGSDITGIYVVKEAARNLSSPPVATYEPPCSDYRTFFSQQLKAWRPATNRREANDYKFAEFLCSQVPNETTSGQKDFVMGFPKLDLSNILVRENGNIAAILGWSEAAVVPRLIGYEAFPRWLASDWFNDPPARPGHAHVRLPDDVLIDMRDSWHMAVQGRSYVRPEHRVPSDATCQSLFFGRLWEALVSHQHRRAILQVLFSRIREASGQFPFDRRSYDDQIEALDLPSDAGGTRGWLTHGLTTLITSYVYLI